MISMIDHFGIVCADFGKSQQFYDAVLGVLGYGRQMEFGPAIGYGSAGGAPPCLGRRTNTAHRTVRRV